MEKVKAALPPEKFASIKDDAQKMFDTVLNNVKCLFMYISITYPIYLIIVLIELTL